MTTITLKGTVFSGKGGGAKFIKLPWVQKQIIEKLGFNPYLGTLNIRLTKNGAELKKVLEKTKTIEISPESGFCRGRCYKAYMPGNLECFIVVPEIANYEEDVIEVISSENLREKLCLEDGDTVQIEIVL